MTNSLPPLLFIVIVLCPNKLFFRSTGRWDFDRYRCTSRFLSRLSSKWDWNAWKFESHIWRSHWPNDLADSAKFGLFIFMVSWLGFGRLFFTDWRPGVGIKSHNLRDFRDGEWDSGLFFKIGDSTLIIRNWDKVFIFRIWDLRLIFEIYFRNLGFGIRIWN